MIRLKIFNNKNFSINLASHNPYIKKYYEKIFKL